ncbi:P-loop containing nucleoside triphosphate hydrolase protein [Suillus subalutaceus]|uniref:P-loop containing nucleoside triphosphate hydrolase protein n=1 Tax=Suillus subalutaceus TaxID=48586 RepID=UPI001B861E87|nr:P-loop containing nucleoside triphosphate hydrolase protein [Suillus subalutaceus]KAG1848092.1 P-loop containing nucleoside triphosphate hydrolase protein [Suillus subalutaceus]
MIYEGHGPQRPDGHPAITDSDWDIIQRCLLRKPKLRPSANKVLDLLCPRTRPPNFVIFGEMGVGKSSLVNLIAGDQLAESSSGAQSCTFETTEYPITFSDCQLNVNLFDTVGLDSPTMNNAGYLDALVKAHELIISLKNRGGIHGLLFCIKAGRVSNTMQQNYRLFFEFLCQEQVPLALVITNLENEENMDDWWTRNRAHIENSGIVPVTHVCITTIKGYQNAYEVRYFESRKKVLNMLKELGGRDTCLVDVNDRFARMSKRLREFLIPGRGFRSGANRDKMV